jgi:CspA family cold shock protein
MAEAINHQSMTCSVKWFDPKKGFGFLVADSGGPDILLHANVLRNAGRGSIGDGVRLEVLVSQEEQRWYATTITSIHPGTGHAVPQLEQFAALDPSTLRDLPYKPARVKWFDLVKGFGFANMFGSSEDVFIHIEVLRSSGLAHLEAGEAVSLRVVEGERGLLAAEVGGWEQGLV